MELKNSYIFVYDKDESLSNDKDVTFSNSDIVEDKTNEKAIVIDMGNSIFFSLKRLFPKAILVETDNEYDRAFRHQYHMETPVRKQGRCYVHIETKIIIHAVQENCYVDIITIGDDKSDIVSAMEKVHNVLVKSEYRNCIIITYDSISEYYCNLAFPMLTNLERLLYKLFYNIYVFNYGMEYYKVIKSEKARATASKHIESGEKERNYMKQYFYTMGFDEINDILFSYHWDDTDDKKYVDYLENNKDLSEISNEELRTTLMKIKPHNEWELLFADKMDGVQMKLLMSQIQKLRNRMVHCKSFSKEDYQNFSVKAKKTIEELNKAIIETEKKDFTSKNMENIVLALQLIKKKMEELNKSINISVSQFVQACGKLSEVVRIETIDDNTM